MDEDRATRTLSRFIRARGHAYHTLTVPRVQAWRQAMNSAVTVPTLTCVCPEGR